MIELNFRPSDRELRWFAALWFTVFWAIVGCLVWYHWHARGVAGALWSFAAAVAVIGLIRPAAVRPLYVGWLVAAFPIGWTVSNLLLLAIYWLVFTPIGLMMRLTGRDPLTRRFDRQAKTYWFARRPSDDKERYLRQY